MKDVKKIKDDYDKGKIKLEDITIEEQKEIAKLYKKEIENTREEIIKIRMEINSYKREIDRLKNKGGEKNE